MRCKNRRGDKYRESGSWHGPGVAQSLLRLFASSQSKLVISKEPAWTIREGHRNFRCGD